MTTLYDLQARAYRQSVAAGWHDHAPATREEAGAINGMKIALMHSELSEALEELRAGREPNQTYYPTINAMPGAFDPAFARGKHKPEGVPSELADVVIRILDFCGANGIDLEEIILEKLDYNATRGHKHGGKAF